MHWKKWLRFDAGRVDYMAFEWWIMRAGLAWMAVQATPASAVLMMAVMDKVGTFGMLRYCMTLFPDAATQFRTPIIVLAVISIVYGAVVAIGQTDVMRLIAYTSISHFGFIILGIFAMTTQGQSGSALYMVSHGVSTAALFLIAGFLVSRRGTRLIAAYGGAALKFGPKYIIPTPFDPRLLTVLAPAVPSALMGTKFTRPPLALTRFRAVRGHEDATLVLGREHAAVVEAHAQLRLVRRKLDLRLGPLRRRAHALQVRRRGRARDLHVVAVDEGVAEVLAAGLGDAIQFTRGDLVAHAVGLVVGEPDGLVLGVDVHAHGVAHAARVLLHHPGLGVDAVDAGLHQIGRAHV